MPLKTKKLPPLSDTSGERSFSTRKNKEMFTKQILTSVMNMLVLVVIIFLAWHDYSEQNIFNIGMSFMIGVLCLSCSPSHFLLRP